MHDITTCYRTSAKNKININIMIEELVEEILKNQ